MTSSTTLKDCSAITAYVSDQPSPTDTGVNWEAAIIAQATAILEKRFLRSDYLTSPDLTRQFLTLTLALEPRELFALVLLDNQHGVLGMETLFQGTLDGASVYPREVVKCVLDANAAAVILVHNHPSGNPQPSQADKTITANIVQALKTVDVRTLDHVVVAGTEIVSFAEKGWI